MATYQIKLIEHLLLYTNTYVLDEDLTSNSSKKCHKIMPKFRYYESKSKTYF